jgi:hypothetical protein
MRKLIILSIIAFLLIVAVPVYAATPGGGPPGLERAINAQEKHNAELLATSGVVGTAVGLADGNPVVQVFVERAGNAGIPKVLEGVPVEVQVTGKIAAIEPTANGKGQGKGPGNGSKSGEPSTTDYWPRPVPIGISTGNANEIAAGTISARVKDSAGNVYALSNNHVYARENQAGIGEEVLQPGRYDTAGYVYDPNNHLGNLSAFVTINFDGVTSNIVDAAIASSTISLLGNATPSSGYGLPKSATVAPVIGMAVQKFGRTSQLTKGTITGINASIFVGYSSGTALFEHQIIVQSNKPFLKSGDSGSLLVGNPSRNPVGLLFAANGSGNYAIANDIGLVLSSLHVTIDGQ